MVDEDLPKHLSLAFHRYGYSPISLSRLLLLKWWYLILRSARVSPQLKTRDSLIEMGSCCN